MSSTNDRIYVLWAICPGPNAKCRAAHKAGRSVHVNVEWDEKTETLVQPTHHFVSEDHGRAMISGWLETAPVISTDAELYAHRKAGTPFKLPVGWVDPSMRRETR